MSGQIFISYRRGDTAGYAGRLYDRLHDRFPQNEIFVDVDMAPGIDFIEEIEKNVGSCDVLIAVIGKHWLTAADEEGRRRLDDPEDFLRLEIATALKRGIRVIPVLVDSASMPQRGELPDDLKPLTRRNALNISHDRFPADAERLISAVEQVLESARVERQRKREEQERMEADQREIEHLQQEEQERLRAEHQLKAEQERLQIQEDAKEDRGTGATSTVQNEAAGASLALGSLEKVLANLKKRWRLLLAVGSSVAVIMLGFSFVFKAPRPTFVSASVAEWLAEAERYLQEKDYAEAVPLLRKAAEAGNAEAMN